VAVAREDDGGRRGKGAAAVTTAEWRVIKPVPERAQT